jgi:hypothetical protein
MHSLLRIANILNAKHQQIKKSIRNNMTLQNRNNKEINKNKNKTLFRSTTFKI